MSLNVFTDYIDNCTENGIEPSWEGLNQYKNKNKEDKKVKYTYAKTKSVVDGVIENEFNHIQESSELTFIKNDYEFNQDQLISDIIRKALEKDMTEKQKKLLDDLEGALANEWIDLCRFYFKEGVAAGLTNLSFLNEIDNIMYMI